MAATTLMSAGLPLSVLLLALSDAHLVTALNFCGSACSMTVPRGIRWVRFTHRTLDRKALAYCKLARPCVFNRSVCVSLPEQQIERKRHNMGNIKELHIPLEAAHGNWKAQIPLCTKSACHCA